MVLLKNILLPLLLLAVVLSYLNIQKKSDVSHSHDLKHFFSDTTFKRDGIVGSRRQLRLRSLMQQPLVQRLFSSQAMDDSKDALSSNFVKISTPEYNEVETFQRTLSRRLSELTDFEADMCEHLRPDVNKRSLSLTEDFGDPRNVDFKAYHQNLLPKEKGLRLLMMGDSITKYMYLSLTYYLSHGMWYSEINLRGSRGGNCYLVSEISYADWHHFFKFTSSVVGSYAHENCDCRRQSPTMDDNYENRFFYDERNENSVSYVQAFPFTDVHSRVNAADAILQDHPLEHMLNDSPPTFTGDWPTFISNYASKLNPKPTHVMLNAGLHPMRDWANHANLDNIVSALKAANMIGIYMTTSDEEHRDAEYEKYMCSKLLCLDMSFAYNDARWDTLHFYDETYVAANKMLLQMIEGNRSNGHNNGFQFALELNEQPVWGGCYDCGMNEIKNVPEHSRFMKNNNFKTRVKISGKKIAVMGDSIGDNVALFFEKAAGLDGNKLKWLVPDPKRHDRTWINQGEEVGEGGYLSFLGLNALFTFNNMAGSEVDVSPMQWSPDFYRKFAKTYGSPDVFIYRTPWPFVAGFSGENIREINVGPEELDQIVNNAYNLLRPKTFIFLTTPVNNIAISDGFVSLRKDNEMIRNFVRQYSPPSSSEGIQNVVFLDFEKLTDALILANAEVMSIPPEIALSHLNTGVDAEDGFSAYYPQLTAMTCAGTTPPAYILQINSCPESSTGILSRDGMHWCDKTTGPRTTAGLACLIECVSDLSDDIEDRPEQLRKCEFSCNHMYMNMDTVFVLDKTTVEIDSKQGHLEYPK